MDKILNEVEKTNARRTLSGDLSEFFNIVVRDVQDFKENLFYKNLLDTQKHVGIFDRKVIPHCYKNIETNKLLKSSQTTKDLFKKYRNKAKTINPNYQ